VANHTHTGAQVTVGTTANLPLKTGTNGLVEAGSFSNVAGSFCAGDDARLSDARTPSSTLAHKASHATGGTDALAPSDIGAQYAFVISSANLTGNTTLASGRTRKIFLNNYSSPAAKITVTLPTTSNENGDILVLEGSTLADDIDIKDSPTGSVVATLSTSGQTFRFIYVGSWDIDRVYNHASQHASAGVDPLAPSDIGAAASGSITSSGLTQSTARILGRTSASTGAVEEIQIGSGLSLSAGELSSTVSAGIPATLLDAKGDLILGSAADTAARLAVGGTNGHVLTVDSAETLGVKWAAAAGGGITAVGASTADVLSVSGSDLVADDGGTIDSSDPFIKWDDVAGKLVYANPLSRPSGAFYVGLAPTTTALGTNSVNIQSGRDNAAHVAKDASSVCVGYGARSTSSNATAVGHQASGANGTAAIGGSTTASNDSVALGFSANSTTNATALGRSANASGVAAISIGYLNVSSATDSVSIGASINNSLRGSFLTRTFGAVYWGGQTTNATPLILNLDATATNRFTIAASTALAVDILLVARRSDTQDKWLVARRFLGIRRDGSNNTSLIGSVQTLGVDQSDGSPSWTFALTADDTNEALQLEVTGAASETIQWRATAFYRVA
jgi:hypothetical protein